MMSIVTSLQESAKGMSAIVLKPYRRQCMLLLLLLSFIITIHAQITMTALLPPGGIYMRSQLWNLSITKTVGAAAEVQVQLQLKDLQSHQTILSAASAPFTINAGINIVRAQSLEPIKYNGASISSVQSANGFLPVGQYQICYQLLYVSYKDNDVVADDCEQLQVEPLQPPLLIVPENDSVVETGTPDFTWTPPAPPAMFSNLNYDILVCEIYKNQSPTEAIQNNFPVQHGASLSQPFFVYPPQGSQLEKGKKYAWQIIAKDQQRLAARSEVWSFTMGDKKEQETEANAVYLLMDDNTHSVGIADSGFVRIKYVSYDQTHQAALTVKDENGSMLINGKREIRQGSNYLAVPLNSRFTSQHNYTIVLTDTKGKTHSLTFTVK